MEVNVDCAFCTMEVNVECAFRLIGSLKAVMNVKRRKHGGTKTMNDEWKSLLTLDAI